MPRRRISEEPISRLAIWARRLALFALAVALLAILVLRLDFIEIVPGLATFGGAVGISVIAVLFELNAFVVIWREGLRGFGYALLAFVIGIGLVTYPAYLGVNAYRSPPLSDISTDLTDPPRFEAIARLRPREANAVAYPGPPAAELQRANYPNIAPLQTSSTPLELYEAALRVVTKRKWRIVDARSPQVGRREGH